MTEQDLLADDKIGDAVAWMFGIPDARGREAPPPGGYLARLMHAIVHADENHLALLAGAYPRLCQITLLAKDDRAAFSEWWLRHGGGR